MINYKNKDIVKTKIRRNYLTNKDHFNNMTPTQTYKYVPHTKQSKFNYYLVSQIDSLPGKRLSRIAKIPIKRSGKKTFYKNDLEESKENFRRNIVNNKLKYKANTNYTNTNNNYGKNSKVYYEFDNPIITSRDMKQRCYV